MQVAQDGRHERVSPVSGNSASALTCPARIVRIIDRLNVGGPAKHVVWLTAGLRGDEFESVLVAGSVPAGEGDMSYFARGCDVEPCFIPEMSRAISPRDIVAVFKLLKLFLKIKPHVVHTHKAKAGAIGRVAAMAYKWATPSALWLRPRDCYIVHTFHGHVFHGYFSPIATRLVVAFERALARTCTDRLVVVSEQQRHEILECFKIGRPKQFRVIHLGIDFEAIRSQPGRLRKELKVGAEQPLIGAVGRLCEIKNHAMFLDAAAGVVAAQPHARFVIIGDGDLRGRLEQQSRVIGISDKVTFTGFREDTPSLYVDLDVVALTSLNEGTPLALIEAMYNGVAVAATEVGGVVDLMGTRRDSIEGFSIWDNGVTAPSQDTSAFTRALNFLIEHPQLRRETGERARAFVIERLSITRLVGDLQELYRECLASTAMQAGSLPGSGYKGSK